MKKHNGVILPKEAKRFAKGRNFGYYFKMGKDWYFTAFSDARNSAILMELGDDESIHDYIGDNKIEVVR